MMYARWPPLLAFVLALVLAVATVIGPVTAGAWTEARPAGLVTEVVVDRDGGATVTLRIRWRILAGRLHQFDLADLPTDLSIVEASAVTSTGAAVPLATHAPAPGRLEVNLGDETGGVRRGSVDVVLRYTTSLRAQGAIRRAGADAVMEVSTVPWERGLEATEIRVALPTSERRAQWISDDTPGVDATTTTELSRDVVHALRRHLPAGTRWTARVAADPSLFPWLTAGVARSPQVPHRTHRPVGAALAFGAALLVALLLAARALVRGVPASTVLHTPRAGALPVALLAAGSALQSAAVAGLPLGLTAGTVSLLMAVALRRPPRQPITVVDPRAAVRVLCTRDVLTLSPARSRVPVVSLTLLTASAVMAVIAARTIAPGGWALGVLAVDLAVAAIALLALRQRRGPVHDAAVLLPVARRVERTIAPLRSARIAWRVRGDGSATGAVRARLVARPGWRLARGVHSVEWSVSMHPGTVAWHGVAVAMVRVDSGSPLERSLRSLATRVGTVRCSPDGDRLAYTVELAGLDHGAFFRALRPLVGELFVRAPGAAGKVRLAEDSLDAVTAVTVFPDVPSQ